jgi:hypothetical protein
MHRLGQWWKRERARPGVSGQLIYIGGVTAIVGLVGIGGGAGSGVAVRVLGAAVMVAGLALVGLAVRRLRR